MEITGEFKIIQQWLSHQGRTPDGRPLFRLVWSDKATEKRLGTYNDFKGSLFIRQVREVREVPKYNYIRERWIIEKWAPPEEVINMELPESSQGSYELIWVFSDKEGNYLKPTMKAVQFLVDYIRKNQKVLSGARRSELMTSLLDADDAEVESFMDAMDISPIEIALNLGEAVGYTKGLK